MHRKVVAIFSGAALVAITSLLFSPSKAATSQADYLSLAKAAIVQAQALDKAPELTKALSAISSVRANFIESANRSLKEALVLSPRAETRAAIEAIARVNEPQRRVSSSTGAEPVRASRAASEDESWKSTLLTVLAPFFVACFAAVNLGTQKHSSSTQKGGWFSSSKKTQAQLAQLLDKIRVLAADPSVPDELILEMRNEARNLRRVG